MDWLVFGDDWGVHPSTTSHLVRSLPAGDRVVWVNSVGMRAPRFSVSDLRKIGRRILSRFAGEPTRSRDECEKWSPDIVSPKLLPFHRSTFVRRINRSMITGQLNRVLASHGMSEVNVLVSNPVSALYLEGLSMSSLTYLRLDDYGLLPGVDGKLVDECEQLLQANSDVWLATAQELLPPADCNVPHRRYLPQGVDTSHFELADLPAKEQRPIVGFFGLVERWLDFELIRKVASLLPEFDFEFIGRRACSTALLDGLPNVRFVGAVDYNELPARVRNWSAAWIPFEVSELTSKVNPLKAREYLSCGLATVSTPMEALGELSDHILISQQPDEIARMLRELVREDCMERRATRRKEMLKHSWVSRAREVSEAVASAL